MQRFSAEANLERPRINDFIDPALFLKSMIEFRKRTERNFSVMAATKELRKVSPSLVTLIIQSKRKMTLDRADEFSKLMALTNPEKIYFKNWLKFEDQPEDQKIVFQEAKKKNRKEFSVHLLSDWLNVYVKDAFRIVALQKNPQLIYKELGAIASKTRIDRSIQFLLREGYLRKTLEGTIVIETSLMENTTPPPGPKVRAFHKAALAIARQNLDFFDFNQRFANTMVLDLTPARYQELVEMIKEFSKSLQDFATVDQQYGDKLYQVVLNLSPTGGRSE